MSTISADITKKIQTSVTPTIIQNSKSATSIQQTLVQQVLLPSNFNAPGMTNFKTLQDFKVIPISAQSTGSLTHQPVLTRLVNSNAIRPVVIQEDLNTTNTSNPNVTH